MVVSRISRKVKSSWIRVYVTALYVCALGNKKWLQYHKDEIERWLDEATRPVKWTVGSHGVADSSLSLWKGNESVLRCNNIVEVNYMV